MIKIHVFEGIRRFAQELLGNFKKFIAASIYNCIEPDKNVNYPFPIIRPSERLNEQKQKICEGKRNAAQQDHVANKKKNPCG